MEIASIYIIRGWCDGWHGPHAVFIPSEYALSCPSAGARHNWHFNFTHCYLSSTPWTANSIFCGYKYNMQPQHSVFQCVQAEIWSEHLSNTSLKHYHLNQTHLEGCTRKQQHVRVYDILGIHLPCSIQVTNWHYTERYTYVTVLHLCINGGNRYQTQNPVVVSM